MPRTETMEATLDKIKEAMSNYYEGLTLDIECLNQMTDIILTNLPYFTCCCKCQEQKPAEEMHKHGITLDNVWHPICKDCFEPTKQFIVIWCRGFEPHVKVTQYEMPMTYFTHGNGYVDSEVTKISALAVGDSFMIANINNSDKQTVLRIR